MNNREIDRLVAEKVMGWEPNLDDDGTVLSYDTEHGNLFFYDDNENDWCPSADIQDAWKVVESLRERKIFTIYDAWDEKDEKIFCANFQYNDTYHVVDYSAYADTAPMAICLAALKAVGVELPEGK
ncbi:hypothetical protein K7T73_13075 [Bacillus badius]|uniref:BC1872 family protein n=1 Tax=Bacillus badius TaxID=1455 RepID=UPI001CC0A1D1|nr:hypothetical protein [Bacillus badius]UAT29532.1 hypothetical protein K7T73_13075 [Bacillus badius]